MKNVCGCYSTGWHCYSCCCCCCWSGGRRRGLRRIKPLMRQIIWSSPITSHLYVWCVFVSIAQIILKDFCSNVARRWYKCNCPAAFSSGIIKTSCNVICCNVQCNDGIEGPLRFGLIQELWLEETVLFICHQKKKKTPDGSKWSIRVLQKQNYYWLTLLWYILSYTLSVTAINSRLTLLNKMSSP